VDEDAALILVARTGTYEETGYALLSLFMVPTDTPGLSWQVIDVEVTAPDRQFTLFFDDAVIPAGNLIGEEHHGFRSVFAGLNPERIMVAALSNGISRYALDKAVAYANDRLMRTAPVSREMVLNFVAQQSLGLPKSY